METERLLTESEAGGRHPEPGEAGAVRRQSGPGHSRRRRKLPDIPKDKKPLEGVSASIFEELSAATPSWAARRLPGEEEEQLAGWSSGQTLPPSLILNVVNLETGDEPVGDADSG